VGHQSGFAASDVAAESRDMLADTGGAVSVAVQAVDILEESATAI